MELYKELFVDPWINQFDCWGSHWIGCPTSPDSLSETLLTILSCVPSNTSSAEALSALVLVDANLTEVVDSLIA